MPKINDLELPTVSVSGDCGAIAAKLAGMNMPLEAMIEVAIYCRRMRERADALTEIEEVMRGRIKEAYAKLPVDKRETCRTEVGIVTYSEGGEKIELLDRDKTVELLTDEQIRITYKPDLKALETILKPAEFARHIRRVPVDPRITLRDMPNSENWQELDF